MTVAGALGTITLTERPERVVANDEATDFEAIAALRPDLILATDSYSIEQDYELLSKIAPPSRPSPRSVPTAGRR